MLDLRYVVDNQAQVTELLARRGVDLGQLRIDGVADTDLWHLDLARRETIRKVETLRHRQRVCGEEIARRAKARADADELKAEMKTVSNEVTELARSQGEIEAQIQRILMWLPNLPDAGVPPGADAAANVEVRRVGAPRAFDFKPQPHWDLGPALGILDFERAAKISGARFAVQCGPGARIERALIAFMLDLHTRERGYLEVVPPYMVTRAALEG
ncbi:MAG: serine--tRNA ligase, partial [Vicinamibacteria bacterium]|nr:serine--tRNA ligase [Vicinamibacteria bacterium]